MTEKAYCGQPEGISYCSIHIDMDDNQWVIPRQRNTAFDVSAAEQYSKAARNIERFLASYPVTLFLVGLDIRVDAKVRAIERLRRDCSNVEIANHSLSHNNNFTCLSHEDRRKEVVEADRIIKDAFDLDCLYGYRSPGYVFNGEILEILRENNYVYDASCFPSFYGPILRTLNLVLNGVSGRSNYGAFRNGFLPNEPTPMDAGRELFEINVSVCPFLRCPIHYSIIRSTIVYAILARFIRRIRHLTFLFHLYDFLDVDVSKMQYVLALITSGRRLVLSKDIDKYCARDRGNPK